MKNVVNMDNGTYSLKEIRNIINQATQKEIWGTRDKQENWDTIQDLKTRFFDMFGIEELCLG